MTQYDHYKMFTFTVNVTYPPPRATIRYVYTRITMASKVLLCCNDVYVVVMLRTRV